MNKSILMGCSILAAAIVAGALIYVTSNRYTTSSGGDGRVYKVDKKTGETVLLAGDQEIGVEPKAIDEPSTDAEQAITLAKKAYILSEYKTNEAVIDEMLKTMKGTLKIQGWKAEDQGDGIYLVTYVFENNAKPKTFGLEVNLPARLVRKVKGDEALEKKYFGKYEPQ